MPRTGFLPTIGEPGGDLPVRGVLPNVISALQRSGTAVLVAPPGSGKTSLLPLALADAFEGTVIVAEPRRIATRAAAGRMAELLGESSGDTVGYSMRGDRRVSARTRIEVVTTGLLVRRLQHDPELAGVEAVVIDEVHERQLDTDLALAFLLDVRANLRTDLHLIATSATADTVALATLLGPVGRPAAVIDAPSTVHPVEVIFAPPAGPVPLLPDARVDPRLLDHVAAVVRKALAGSDGSVLVFLPGAAEIAAIARRLSDLPRVFALFGRQTAAEQDLALRGGQARRVVLSTAVAESSLTVPGVSIVVDAGLSREPRMDAGRGLGTLVTTKVSRSSADQRAGRAGREGPGRVYRCWSALSDSYLPDHPHPEIATADLTGFALAVADWGSPGGRSLALLDRPPEVALAAAEATLQALGALDAQGRITVRGRELARVPAPPRLARALLDGAALVGRERAAEVVALISEETGTGPDQYGHHGDDLVARWRGLRSGSDRSATSRWRQEVRRLSRTGDVHRPEARGTGAPVGDDLTAGIVVGLAFPERMARLRRPDGRSYLMAGGTGAELAPGTELLGSPWLAIAVADRPSGRAAAQIRAAATIELPTALEIGASQIRIENEIAWRYGGLVLHSRRLLGAIELSVQPLRNPDPMAVAAAIRSGLRREGLNILPWSRSAQGLRRRLALLHRVIGAPWPDVSDAGLLASVDTLLGSDLQRIRTERDFNGIDLTAALRRLLPWPAAARMHELAPERIEAPSGSLIPVDYSAIDFTGDGDPVLAVKVQEAFGWTDGPALADGRVPVVLHLLSPAGRPAAITSDLVSFWRQGYPQVRAELRSRYPRQAWPDDPLTAPAVRRPPRRT